MWREDASRMFEKCYCIDRPKSCTMVNLCIHQTVMSKEETTFPAIQDDQYIEFYENNPDMVHFDPPLTINEFKALLEKSLKQDGKATQSTIKVSPSRHLRDFLGKYYLKSHKKD